MRPAPVKLTIGRLMIVVAVVGVLCAWTSTLGVVLIFGPLILAFLCPFFARPGRRLLMATWVAALWPLSIPWALHVAWLVVYGYLGHPPGQGDNGTVSQVMYDSVAMCLCLGLFSTILCLFLQLGFLSDDPSKADVSQVERAIPILLIPAAWCLVVVVMRWDPVRAGDWFMD